MVDNADIFQDLSSSSIFSNSQILQKSMLSQNTGGVKGNDDSVPMEASNDDSPKFGDSKRHLKGFDDSAQGKALFGKDKKKKKAKRDKIFDHTNSFT